MRVDQLLLGRKAADALHQIDIGVAVARHEPPHPGQDAEGIEIVELLELGQHHLAELQAEEAPAGLQHPARLGQGLVDLGDIAQPEGDGIGIDAAVGQGQGLGIARHPIDPGDDSAVDGPVAPDRQHGRGQIADDDPGARPRLRQKALGDVAGPAGDIEQELARPGRQPIDHGRLPQAVDAPGHQIVHQVVAPGDALENAAHQARLLRRLDAAVAEPGLVILDGGTALHLGNIARRLRTRYLAPCQALN